MEGVLAAGPMLHSRRTPDPRVPRGITLAELLWLAVLGALIAWVILGTLDNELREARERLARDTLEHLAGMLTLALEEASPELPDLPRAGPGELPAGLDAAPRGDLADLLPPGAWLPPDPWGRAYVLLPLLDSPESTHLAVASGGPMGVLETPGRRPEAFTELLLIPKPQD